nr:hypothetical protein [Elusimicrobiota bacterium]
MQLPPQQNSDYLFLVGKVRVYEAALFDRGYFHRLINSGSRNRFIKELSDTKYRSAAEDMASDGSDNFIIVCNGYLYDIY